MRFGDRSFVFGFLLAAVTRPILGNDFLAANNLLVDPAQRRVLDAATLAPLGRPMAATAASPLVAALSAAPPAVRSLLAAFPTIQSADLYCHKPLHGVEHVVETSGPPVFAKARRLDPAKQSAAEAEFRELERAGIVRRSQSPWASPLHLVPKKDGSWRPCGDYRRLNLVTKHDRYPLPNVQDCSARLAGCRVFSVIDLVKGYHQVPMAEADIPKTAIVTPFGLFEYVTMPFGLRNAAQTFQRLMDRLFREYGFTFVYLDDILVSSESEAEHLKHLHAVFTTLATNGLVINPAKCVFAQAAVDFLGHRVSAGGIAPLSRQIAAIEEFPAPDGVKALQRFLGLINYYRRFLPGIAGTLKPLTDALKGSPKTLEWSEDRQAAFLAAKAALASAVPLHHPDPAASLSLATDASATHIGGVLQQAHSDSPVPLAFFSRKLTPAEVRYSTFDRELLAAFAAVRHFRFLLEGRQFVLYTDHKPLTTALHRVSPPWSARQQRHLSALAEFSLDLVHTPGTSNVVADALSRPHDVASSFCGGESDCPSSPPAINLASAAISLCGAIRQCAASVQSTNVPALPIGPVLPKGGIHTGTVSTNVCALVDPDAALPLPPGPLRAHVPAPLSFADMARDQATCNDVLRLAVSPTLRVVPAHVSGRQLLCDTSTGVDRPLVPATCRRAVFDHVHGAGHPGMRATRRLVSSRFVWTGLAKQVSQWTRECVPCQSAKTYKHVHLRAEPIPVPSRRFAHIHVDLVGPLPSSNGFQYLFTVIDRSTRWPEAVPLAATSAVDCARALFRGWIQRFGVPSTITSDRGAQFTSGIWRELCLLLNISHVPTTSFHPQSNGLVERFHRRLKDALRARCAASNWYHHLPWVMLAVRATPREDSNISPSDAVFGSPLIVPGQFLDSPEPPADEFYRQLEAAMSRFSPVPTRHNASKSSPLPATIPTPLLLSRFVFVRRDGHKPPLSPTYDGPYRVLSRSPHFFRLQLGDRSDTVSVHRLKPAFLPDDAVPAVPPKRGRPPRAASPLPPPPPLPTPSPPRVRFTFPLTTRAGRVCRPPLRLGLAPAGSRPVGE